MNKIICLYFVIILLSACTNTEAIKYKHVEDTEQIIVYAQENRFAAWPANNGAWLIDGDEILVGFTEAPYVLKKNDHNIGDPMRSWLARSADGGENWVAYDPEDYVGDFGDQPDLKMPEEPIDFEAPRFVMRIIGTAYHGADDPRGHFFYSYDGGISWKGPFSFGNLLHHPEIEKYGLGEITPRTDYVVTGKNECLFFISAREKDQFGTDRLFCLKTVDGGKTFDFMGWIVKPYKENEIAETTIVSLYEDNDKNPYATQCRAVMSQTFKLKNGKLLSVMRRKYVPEEGKSKNWVDAYASMDGGKTWSYQSKVGDAGDSNGNPPALGITKDGRLCAVFGERKNGTIQVSYSSDEGKTWDEPMILLDDFWSEDMEYIDLGYPRVVTRSDGKMVAVFYYSTKEFLHHIHATIWDPEL
jgi:hypothetical protein